MNENMPADLIGLVAGGELTRRKMLVTTLATGFALAVQPVSAQTITTDTNGLTAGEVKIPVQDGQMPAYRAMPATGRHFPLVLVVPEIFGVHEHIKDICRRFAKLGYVAVAPELFAREGDVSKITNIPDLLPIVSKVPDAQAMSDLDAAVRWAEHKSRGDASHVGITGFCWGGRIVWLYATHNPNLKAAVAWYGRLAGTPSERQPKFPLDVVSELKAPVLGLYGGRDEAIPLADIEKMRAALKEANRPGDIIVYPDAPHGFNADYRPSYRAGDAHDGWRRLLEWFHKYGVA
ncbi:MAG TPA: dienelactone hydrolase family protein [Steroidobacteraceae bacterium]